MTAALSHMEGLVLGHWADGKTIDETASAIGIARSTVKIYRERIREKTGEQSPHLAMLRSAANLPPRRQVGEPSDAQVSAFIDAQDANDFHWQAEGRRPLRTASVRAGLRAALALVPKEGER